MFPTIALFSWPVVVAILFQRLPRPQALIASLMAGYLLLPVQGGIDLPLLPPLEKFSIPAISALIFVLLIRPRDGDPPARPGLIPQGVFPRIMLFGIVFGSFMTVLTNGDPLYYGARVLPALRTYDAFSAILLTLTKLLPLLLARKFLGHPEQQRQLLMAFCIAGLGYSLLALYEVRMSPQLNNMVYGFFPHSWVQHIRANGFRPVVFLSHGLQLAVFFFGALMATVALMRLSEGPRRMQFLLAALWLFMTLVLAKSLGALVIAIVLTPVILFLGARVQLLVAAIVVVLIISYPLSRGAGIVPIDRVTQIATEFDAQRGSSLQTRLTNEDRLLDHAAKRPAFGWGGWGRNRVYDSNGTDITITDGYWVIAIAGGGWIRFLSEFLLLGGAVVLLFLRRRQYEIGMETSALAVIVAAGMVDLVPNSALTVLLWMTAGALWGRLELARVSDTPRTTPLPQGGAPASAYTRMPQNSRRPGAEKLSSRATRPPRYARNTRLTDAQGS